MRIRYPFAVAPYDSIDNLYSVPRHAYHPLDQIYRAVIRSREDYYVAAMNRGHMKQILTRR